MITLFRGHPSNNLLPNEEILLAAQKVLLGPRTGDDDEETRHPLTYGSDMGAYEVRKAFADWINLKNKTEVAPATPECINLTNGASFGAFTALIQCCPSDYTEMALAISPTYYLINQIFIDAGFKGRMRAVVETEKGIDFDGLISLLEEPSDPIDPLKFKYVLYLVPVFSNPGGYTITEEDSLRLLEIARKYNILLLCDHVYDYLQYSETPIAIKTLVNLDRATLPPNSLGNVIANYSLSKYLGPGLRVGWQEVATPKLAYHLSQSGSNKSGGSPSHLNTFIAKELISSGQIDDILNKLNYVYGNRSKLYLDAMNKYLPKNTKIRGGHGGYFFWVEFPEGYNLPSISEECKFHRVVLAPGENFEVANDLKGWGKNCFRVSLSFHEPDEAIKAIEIWGEVSQRHFSPSIAS